MIHYKDMTFCSYWNDCKAGGTCARRYTFQVKEAARKTGLPVCLFDNEPDCYEWACPFATTDGVLCGLIGDKNNRPTKCIKSKKYCEYEESLSEDVGHKKEGV